MSNQASVLISEEPGREGGSQVALEWEKVQPWTGVVFVYIYCPFGQYFEIETYLEWYAERENTQTQTLTNTDPLQHYSIFADLHINFMSNLQSSH